MELKPVIGADVPRGIVNSNCTNMELKPRQHDTTKSPQGYSNCTNMELKRTSTLK